MIPVFIHEQEFENDRQGAYKNTDHVGQFKETKSAARRCPVVVRAQLLIKPCRPFSPQLKATPVLLGLMQKGITLSTSKTKSKKGAET